MAEGRIARNRQLTAEEFHHRIWTATDGSKVGFGQDAAQGKYELL